MRIPWNKIDQDILQGMDPSKVSKKYGVSINTIKSRIFREGLLEKRDLAKESGNLASIVNKISTGKAGSKDLAVIENSIYQINKIAPQLIGDDRRLSITRMCSRCNISKRCTFYRKGEACSISAPVKADTSEDLINIVQSMISLETDRILQAITEEKRGGSIGFNLDLSEAIFNLMKIVKIVRDMSSNTDEIYISAKGPGILSRLFGGVKE
jgi:hypothetical protein